MQLTERSFERERQAHRVGARLRPLGRNGRCKGMAGLAWSFPTHERVCDGRVGLELAIGHMKVRRKEGKRERMVDSRMIMRQQDQIDARQIM